MPVVATMGLKQIFITPAGEASGTMPAYGDAWVSLGDVYQETCSLKDSDPEITKHKSETSSKKITQIGETDTTMELTLMDPDLELLAKYFGGNIDGSKGKRKWVKPKKLPYKEWAIFVQPEEGLFVGCASVTIIPKFDIGYSPKGICLVPIKIEFQSELVMDEGLIDPSKPNGGAV